MKILVSVLKKSIMKKNIVKDLIAKRENHAMK